MAVPCEWQVNQQVSCKTTCTCSAWPLDPHHHAVTVHAHQWSEDPMHLAQL